MREQQSIVLIILILTASLLSSYLVYDVGFRDSDHDGLRDWVERHRYGTDPLSADSDGDGLNDAYEIKADLDPLRPNPLYVYLRDRGYVELYELFRPLEANGLSEAERDLVEAYLSLSGVERNDSHIIDFLKSVMEDGVVEKGELELFRDRAFRYCLTKGLEAEEAEVFRGVSLDEGFEELLTLYIALNQTERRCAQTLNILRGIVEDGLVSGDEAALFDDMFVDPTKPVVEITWRPIRVVNDKIYDIEVTVRARDDKTPITHAELRFIPVEYHYMIEKYQMRPEDYPKVFPPEEERDYNLTPIDGAFDNLNETFKLNITDIKGGREYRIVAIIEDEAGNINVEEIKTPYIRQYENIAKLDNITIAAFYYNWYIPNYHIPKNLPDPPLLGFYYSNDNIVFNKHVDWATGYGIDVFVFPFPYPEGIAFDWLKEIFKKNMETDLFDQIKFSFCSTFVDNTAPKPPYNFDDPEVKQEFIDSINYIKDHYAYLPNFWRINGKPVIVSWNTHVYLGKESVHNAFVEVKSNEDIYLLGHIPSNLAIEKKFYPFLSSPVYGIYNYQPLLAPFHPWEMNTWPRSTLLKEDINKVLPIIDKWQNFCKTLGIRYIPTISPSIDKTYDYRDTNRPPIILRDIESFKILIQNSLNKNSIIFITSFNEWFEDTQIEPSVEYGFDYLEALKEVLTNYDG